MYFKNQNMCLSKPMFKKRYDCFKEYKNSHLFYTKKILLDLNFLKKHIVRLRKLASRRKVNIFICYTKNYIISKKSKNARMGKGKGKFKRFFLKSKVNQPLIRTKFIQHRRLFFLN